MLNIIKVNNGSGIIIKTQYEDKDFIFTANHTLEDEDKENKVECNDNEKKIVIIDILREPEKDIAVLVIEKVQFILEEIEFGLEYEKSVLKGYSNKERKKQIFLTVDSLSTNENENEIQGVINSSPDHEGGSLENYLHGFSGGPLIKEVDSKKICQGVLLKTLKNGGLCNAIFAPYTLFEKLLNQKNLSLNMKEMKIKKHIKEVKKEIDEWIQNDINKRYKYKEILETIINKCNQNIKIIENSIEKLKSEKNFTRDEILKIIEFLIIHKYILDKKVDLEQDKLIISKKNTFFYFGNDEDDFDINKEKLSRLCYSNQDIEMVDIINIYNLSDIDDSIFQCIPDECSKILDISNSYLFQDFTKVREEEDNFCNKYTLIDQILFCCADCFKKTKYKKGEKKIYELYKEK